VQFGSAIEEPPHNRRFFQKSSTVDANPIALNKRFVTTAEIGSAAEHWSNNPWFFQFAA